MKADPERPWADSATMWLKAAHLPGEDSRQAAIDSIKTVREPVAAGALWAALSPGWLFTEGVMTARDLAGCEVALGLRGLLVEESESWESCTVTQLITLVLWLVPELRRRRS